MQDQRGTLIPGTTYNNKRQYKGELQDLYKTLEQRRTKARATFMYKIVNNLVDVHAEHIITPSDNRTRGNAAYRTL
jgi:hypothetical protein